MTCACDYYKQRVFNSGDSEARIASTLKQQLGQQLEEFEQNIKRPPKLEKAKDIVLYGFGRIGRLLARLLLEKTGAGEKMMLRAIVVRKPKTPDLVKRATLLENDSVHGKVRGEALLVHVMLWHSVVMPFPLSTHCTDPRCGVRGPCGQCHYC